MIHDWAPTNATGILSHRTVCTEADPERLPSLCGRRRIYFMYLLYCYYVFIFLNFFLRSHTMSLYITTCTYDSKCMSHTSSFIRTDARKSGRWFGQLWTRRNETARPRRLHGPETIAATVSVARGPYAVLDGSPRRRTDSERRRYGVRTSCRPPLRVGLGPRAFHLYMVVHAKL